MEMVCAYNCKDLWYVSRQLADAIHSIADRTEFLVEEQGVILCSWIKEECSCMPLVDWSSYYMDMVVQWQSCQKIKNCN